MQEYYIFGKITTIDSVKNNWRNQFSPIQNWFNSKGYWKVNDTIKNTQKVRTRQDNRIWQVQLLRRKGCGHWEQWDVYIQRKTNKRGFYLISVKGTFINYKHFYLQFREKGLVKGKKKILEEIKKGSINNKEKKNYSKLRRDTEGAPNHPNKN